MKKSLVRVLGDYWKHGGMRRVLHTEKGCDIIPRVNIIYAYINS